MQQTATLAKGAEERSSPRDEVFLRTRGTGPAGRPMTLVVVNLSQGGLMARCPLPLATGDRVRIELPLLGMMPAEIRWALGGRIGCQFDRAVAAEPYYRMLGTIDRG